MALTATQIRAAADDALINSVTPREMVALLERAILESVISGTDGSVSLPWSTVASDGTQMTRVPMDVAERLLSYFSRKANGGIIAQLTEFR